MSEKIQIAINHLKVGNIHIPHIEMAINALEKQMLKSIQFDENDMNICPICKEHVRTEHNYC